MPVIDRDGLAAATEFALPPPDMERFAQFSETPIDPTETTSIEQGVAEAAHAPVLASASEYFDQIVEAYGHEPYTTGVYADKLTVRARERFHSRTRAPLTLSFALAATLSRTASRSTRSATSSCGSSRTSSSATTRR